MTLLLHMEPVDRTFIRPLQTAAGTIYTRRGFVLQLYRDDRCVAQGECSPLPGFSQDTLDACRDHAAHWTLDPTPVATWIERLKDAEHLPALRCSIESMMVQLDALSLEDRVDWSAKRRTQVRVNALAHDVDSAQERVKEGFRVLKIKVGAQPIARDVERVRAIRQAVGDTITLRLDANGAWSFQDAQTAIEAFNPWRISLLEEPLHHATPEALSLLRAQSPIPLAADEHARDARSIHALLAQDAVDAIVLKPMLVGGPLRALRLARIAQERGVYSIITTALEGPVGTRMCAEVAARLSDDRAHGLGTGLLFQERADFPVIHQGSILVEGGA